MGNIPNLVNKDIVNMLLTIRDASNIFIIKLNKRRDLAKDWTIKYIIILLDEELFLFIINGINIIIFTSNPSHIWNQDSVEKETIVLVSKIE